MKLILDKDLLVKMSKHAKNIYPNECCGFVFGEDLIDERRVTEIKEATNSKKGDQRRRFEIDPLDYLKAERYALEKETTLLGIYHSHPNHPALPSEHDLKRAVPYFSYLILATEKEGVSNTTSWQLHDERFVEEEIIIENKIEL